MLANIVVEKNTRHNKEILKSICTRLSLIHNSYTLPENASMINPNTINGINIFNLVIPVDIIPFKINIDSVRIKDSATSCNAFNFKGLAFTNNAAKQTGNGFLEMVARQIHKTQHITI